MRSEQMKPRTERRVIATRGLYDGALRRMAVFHSEFQQIEKQPRALATAQGQAEQPIDSIQDGERHRIDSHRDNQHQPKSHFFDEQFHYSVPSAPIEFMNCAKPL